MKLAFIKTKALVIRTKPSFIVFSCTKVGFIFEKKKFGINKKEFIY